MKPAALLLLSLCPLRPLPAAEDAVPMPVTAARFQVLLERPPFRRVMGLSDSLVLSGVASVPGGRMVTVWNRATKESFLVTSAPNAQGWHLVSLTESSDLKNVAAVIASGDQSLTLRFDPERLTPPKLDNMSRPAGRSESQVVVEALLRGLDPAAAKTFETLPAEGQEKFRKSFAGFLDTYPAATDGQRVEFVRRTLAEIPAPPAPAAPSPSPSAAVPAAQAVQPGAPPTASPPVQPPPANPSLNPTGN